MNRRPADRRGPICFSHGVRSGRRRSRPVWALRVLFVVLLVGGTALRWHDASADEAPAQSAANLPLVPAGGNAHPARHPSPTAVPPTATSSPKASATADPSATPTSSPSSIATRTSTPIPPTATATNTNTPVPPTATNTNTPVPLTATATSTPPPPTAAGTSTPPASSTITVDDSVQGTGPDQFNYAGAWGHCLPCSDGAQIGMYDLSNSWDATAGDYLTVAFTGTGIRLYAVERSRAGIGAVSIDGGAETLVDTYAATDQGNQLLWSSPPLPAGAHTLKLRVTGTKNPSSSDFYVTPDRVDILTTGAVATGTSTGTPVPATATATPPLASATATGTPQAGTQWINVTSNLANMPSQCGNLTMLSAVPNSSMLIAGVALDGLWASTNGGASWSQLGTGSGSDVITNRPSWITYDPLNAANFWESGIYNSNGVYRTVDGGNTFQHLGAVTHDDFISVDYADPNRQTLLVGGHEQSQSVWKSTDGGQTWANIGLNLPSGTGFSTDPLIISAQTYVVNTDTSWGGGSPGIYRTTDGGTTWTRVSSVDAWGPPLVAANGTVYWSSGGSLVKSTDQGVTWTLVGSGLTGQIHPIALPDGRLVSVAGTSLVSSADGGASWSALGPAMPYTPAGVVYSVARKAFFVWTWDCGSVVLPNAIERLDYDFGFPTATPTPTTSSTPI